MKFSPRFSCPSRDNKYYNSNINPFVSAGYGMFQNNGNCTCYAYGRFMEEAGWNSCNLSTGNAENFYTKTSDGYPRGQTPKLGAIICWEGIGSKAGHVAVVEQINSDGSILTSNSAWQGGLFYTKTLYPPYYYMGDGYAFQGFIYNPDIEDTPTPQPTNIVSTIQSTLNERYGYQLVVDGLAGRDTWLHLRMALQHELNVQYGAGLVEDGIFGPATKGALENVIVTYGARGNITWLIQACLYIEGYNPCGLDGIFGNGTKDAVGAFQRARGLYVDYIVGYNTFLKLFD